MTPISFLVGNVSDMSSTCWQHFRIFDLFQKMSIIALKYWTLSIRMLICISIMHLWLVPEETEKFCFFKLFGAFLRTQRTTTFCPNFLYFQSWLCLVKGVTRKKLQVLKGEHTEMFCVQPQGAVLEDPVFGSDEMRLGFEFQPINWGDGLRKLEFDAWTWR